MYFSYVPSIIFSFFNRPLFLNLLFKQILIHWCPYHRRSLLVAAIGVGTAENGPSNVGGSLQYEFGSLFETFS